MPEVAAAITPPNAAIPMAAKKTVSKKKPHEAKPSGDEAPKAAAIFLRAWATGNVLWIKRGQDGDHPGEWCAPGGKIEKNEPPMIAALRELREETGFINETDKEPSHMASFHTGDVQLALYELMINNEFTPTLNEENSAWAWAPLEAPPEPVHTGLQGKGILGQDAEIKTIEQDEAKDSGFKESEHPRGQPENAGQFVSGSASSASNPYVNKSGKEKAASAWERGYKASEKEGTNLFMINEEGPWAEGVRAQQGKAEPVKKENERKAVSEKENTKPFEDIVRNAVIELGWPVDKIEIVPKETIFGSQAYYTKDGVITIVADFYKKNMSQLRGNIAHEIYHGKQHYFISTAAKKDPSLKKRFQELIKGNRKSISDMGKKVSPYAKANWEGKYSDYFHEPQGSYGWFYRSLEESLAEMANNKIRTGSTGASGLLQEIYDLIDSTWNKKNVGSADSAANQATHAELTRTIKFPPPQGPGGERAINIEFANGRNQSKVKRYGKDSDFKEAEHPRDDDGKFSEGGGGSFLGKIKGLFGNKRSASESETKSAQPEWLSKISTFKQGAKEATPEQKTAISIYTDTDYKTINDSLREGGSFSKTGKNLQSYLLASSTPEDATVYRREYTDKFKETPVDTIISNRGFSSTTMNPNPTGEGRQSAKPAHTIEIFVSKGSKASYIGHYSDHPDEHEMLLPAGSRFKVISKDGGNVKLELMPDTRNGSALDADFKENEHPRDDDGKFTEGAGGGAANVKEGTHTFDLFSELPDELNGVKFTSFEPPEDWNKVEGINHELQEKPLKSSPEQTYEFKGETYRLPAKKPASGVMIKEPDGRIWLMKPMNQFGGYKNTFPKGKVDEGLSPQANAIKEAWEETGLHVRITGVVGDFEGDTSHSRIYTAERIGGTPKEAGWETEGVMLAKPEDVHGLLNRSRDRKIAVAGGIAAPSKNSMPAWTKAGAKESWKPSHVSKAEEKGKLAPKPSSKAGGGGNGLKMGELTQIGGKLGSNEGGRYKDKDGKEYYIKKLKSPEHVKNELLAGALFNLAGAGTLKYVPVDESDRIATSWEKMDKNNVKEFSPEEGKKAQEDFAVHAWTANWDAAGLDFDNQSVHDGKIISNDLGGALSFRAQGAPKGAAFGNTVGEWETLRDPKMNPQNAAMFGSVSTGTIAAAAKAGKMFGDMTQDQLKASAKRVTDIPDEAIRKAVKDNGLGDDMANKLIARKKDIAKRVGLQAADGRGSFVGDVDKMKSDAQDGGPGSGPKPGGKKEKKAKKYETLNNWNKEGMEHIEKGFKSPYATSLRNTMKELRAAPSPPEKKPSKIWGAISAVGKALRGSDSAEDSGQYEIRPWRSIFAIVKKSAPKDFNESHIETTLSTKESAEKKLKNRYGQDSDYEEVAHNGRLPRLEARTFGSFVGPVFTPNRGSFKGDVEKLYSGSKLHKGSFTGDASPYRKKIERAIAMDRSSVNFLRAKENGQLRLGRLAFDESMRYYDMDGRLHIKLANISKATVNPYIGNEIPDYQKLGLNANNIYYLYRDPEELEEAAATFNGLPLLSEHQPVTATSHDPKLVVGSTGTSSQFNNPYLQNGLVIWPQADIKKIEKNDKRQISCGYRYEADMTPGVSPQGEKYDGVMRKIVGNHVALVVEGRAGADVTVPK